MTDSSMDIQTFLDQCAGKWFSQRTSYSFSKELADNNKTELQIERLSQSHPTVLSLCQAGNFDPNLTLGGTQVTWDSPAAWDQSSQQGSTTLILLPDQSKPHSGQLLQAVAQNPNSLLLGRYLLGQDEALTLILEKGATHWEERIWFASPNLRLRSSLIVADDGNRTTAFYSEIRRVPPKKAEA